MVSAPEGIDGFDFRADLGDIWVEPADQPGPGLLTPTVDVDLCAQDRGGYPGIAGGALSRGLCSCRFARFQRVDADPGPDTVAVEAVDTVFMDPGDTVMMEELSRPARQVIVQDRSRTAK